MPLLHSRATKNNPCATRTLWENCSAVNESGYKKPLIALLVLLASAVTGCTSDVAEPGPTGSTAGTSGGNTGTTNSGGTQNTTGAASNGLYTLNLSNDNVLLVEGSEISINVQVRRSDGHNSPVNLAVEGQSASDTVDLSWQFSDTQISNSESSATITFHIDIAPLPIQRQVRMLRILGTDGNSQAIVSVLRLEIAPTNRADVYLLVGQSNMVGFSLPNSKQALAGQADAPDNRIQQLNVTGNDATNFSSFASFTNINSIAVAGQRLSVAVDPLHDGFDNSIRGKEGTQIGLGLSFAKRALQDTQASIYLVPAAWSNTGFCARERPDYEGSLGWNATPNNNPALSGTLLHDRAIARANLALSETGGILRGILWHQGEADSDNAECARLYEQNLRALVASLRTNINQDARGPNARGPNADVPFVLGTMSKGPPYDFLTETKQIVDSAHRNVQSIVPFSAFVDNDDLVPPAYPCGQAGCIHFGATAYREMGSRFYDFLRQAAQQ